MILVALIAVPVTVMGQAADQSPIEIPFVKFVLPNGLTVITHEDRTAPIPLAGCVSRETFRCHPSPRTRGCFSS